MSTRPQVICITGCTRGLGRALLEGFAGLGWRVAGCGRDAEEIAHLQKRYPEDYFAVADVADYEAVERFASGAVEKLGSPRFLVNNAAVINANAPLWEVGVEEFARLMQINVNGTFHVIRAFLPGMAEAGVGTIINFSSGWGRSTSPEVAPYCASKFAIEGLTQALAQELPPGLVTVALNPGVIHTQMLESCFGAAASHSHTPEVWARMAVPFLLGLREADNGRSLTVLG